MADFADLADVKKGSEDLYDIIIIGGGPAGLSAAIYTSRAKYKTLCLEAYMPGGQITRTYEVANYPGFSEPISGVELAEHFYTHALRLGAEFKTDTVIKAELLPEIKTLYTKKGKEYKTRSVIICSGATPRSLNIPGEKEYLGRGVSYCATCDAAFFEGKQVFVIGGGNTAIEEALFLTRYVKQVKVVVRKPEGGLRCQDYLRDQAYAHPQIEFLWEHVPLSINGETEVQSITLRNLTNKQEVVYPTDGVFIFIGENPATGYFQNQIECDANAYIIADQYMQTNVAGVFAAGDAVSKQLRQIVTAASDGAIAATNAQKYINEQKRKKA